MSLSSPPKNFHSAGQANFAIKLQVGKPTKLSRFRSSWVYLASFRQTDAGKRRSRILRPVKPRRPHDIATVRRPEVSFLLGLASDTNVLPGQSITTAKLLIARSECTLGKTNTTSSRRRRTASNKATPLLVIACPGSRNVSKNGGKSFSLCVCLPSPISCLTKPPTRFLFSAWLQPPSTTGKSNHLSSLVGRNEENRYP